MHPPVGLQMTAGAALAPRGAYSQMCEAADDGDRNIISAYEDLQK